MRKLPTWRTLVIAAVCLFAFLSLLPNFLSQATRDKPARSAITVVVVPA